MARFSRAQRRALAEQLAAWMRERVQDESTDVEFTVEHGFHVEVGDDLESAHPRPNGTATLVLRINGGAQNTGDLAGGARADAA